MRNPIKSTSRRVAIVGGGLAALRCIEELRRGGHEGSIAIVTAEPHLPYDRPPLSKDVLLGKKELGDVQYRDDAFYRDHEVDMYLSHPATELRIAEREVVANGSTIAFDDLLVCTGASPRSLPLKSDLDGIYTLGRIEDTLRLRAALRNGTPRVVILGAGFIGGEVASCARSLGLDTTLVNLAATPLERAIGPEMGAMLSGLHADHGARLLCSVSIAEIYGEERVEALLLTNGERIACDILVVGIGSAPNIGWLEGSGLELANGIVCDEALSAGPPGIYAAGDVAWWPNGLFGRGMRCEQWTNAAEQGRHVARNMLAGHEERTPFLGSNYFWSDQYGHRIQFAGSEVADEVRIVRGSYGEGHFLAYYRKGDQLCGALALNEPKSLMLAKQQIEKRTSWNQALEALA